MAYHEHDHLLVKCVSVRPEKRMDEFQAAILKSTGDTLGYYVMGPDSLFAFSERIGAVMTQQEREHALILMSGLNGINLSMNRTLGPSHTKYLRGGK